MSLWSPAISSMRSKNFLGKKCVYASIRMDVAPGRCSGSVFASWRTVWQGKTEGVLARRAGAVHCAPVIGGETRRDLRRQRLRPEAARLAHRAHHPDARLEALDRELAVEGKAVHQAEARTPEASKARLDDHVVAEPCRLEEAG